MSRIRVRAWALVLGVLFVLSALACNTKPKPDTSPSGSPGADSPPPDLPGQVKIVIAYGSEKKTWFDEQVAAFRATRPTTKSKRPIAIDARAMGSGEAVYGIVSGNIKAHVFSPASSLYVGMLNSAWTQKTSRPKALSPAGDALVLSPVVVAMWKPMAEALGWPGKPVGWSDLLKINTNPQGWGSIGRAEWGRFKLGHTHPEFSNSGLESIVAEAYAGAKKTRGLTAADVQRNDVVQFVESIEQTIVHYGKSTGFFADKMLARGPSYVSAAVLYENLVIESYTKQTSAPMPIVAVYPTEGTFWSDHPYSILDADWVGADERDAAEAFLRFLKAKPAQERALALGFRPADPSIPVGAPIDAAHGVDPKQPQTLLEVPEGAVIDKLLEVWRQRAKRQSDVMVVFDTSGSMNGQPMQQAKIGAKAFLDTLNDHDQFSLLFFSSKPNPPFGPKSKHDGYGEFVSRIDGQFAAGGTALYDSIAAAFETAEKRAATEPAKIHAVVVMTDGMDEDSQMPLITLTNLLSRRKGETEADVKVFTIGYGKDADMKVLGAIADSARGTSAKGSVTNIVDVFRDMAAFF